MKKTLIALFATASVFAGVSAAQADNQTSNLTVRATLTNGCNINFLNGASVVDFGLVNDLSADKSEQRQFEIKCTNSLTKPDGSADTNAYAPASVALNQGSVTGSTVANRLLGNVSDSAKGGTLQFQVFKGNAGSKDIWGDNASGDNSVYETKDVNAVYPFQVVLLKQDIAGKAAGTYENTMVATVSYTAEAGK